MIGPLEFSVSEGEEGETLFLEFRGGSMPYQIFIVNQRTQSSTPLIIPPDFNAGERLQVDKRTLMKELDLQNGIYTFTAKDANDTEAQDQTPISFEKSSSSFFFNPFVIFLGIVLGVLVLIAVINITIVSIVQAVRKRSKETS